MDKHVDDKSKSLQDVDTSSGQVCLAGTAIGVDATATFNRRVTFSYVSNGTISKETEKKVSEEFVSVTLNLLIQSLRPTADGGPIEEYNQDAQLELPAKCKLRAKLSQPGGPQSTERARDRVTLDCDLGENFSAFPELSEQFLDNIRQAFTRRNFVKAHLKRGKLKINHSGIESLPEDDREGIFDELRAACAPE